MGDIEPGGGFDRLPFVERMPEMEKMNRRIGLVLGVLGLAAFVSGCSEMKWMSSKGGDQVTISSQPWGEVNGQEVKLYTLTNSHGMRADITNYGGIVVRLFVPDDQGNVEDVVLGYDTLDDYVKNNGPYFGCLVGRYANRIDGGTFKLDGESYQLAQNDGKNSLHGGKVGFNQKVWDSEPIESGKAVGVKLHYVSPDGEEGYPGTLDATVTITLTADNELVFDYEATTDKPTIINLTHHGYFNLDGQGDGNILDHKVEINADTFTPIDETLIPTGEFRPVAGTPLDFTQEHAIGERIGMQDDQLDWGNGYDHNYVLNRKGKGLSLAAEVEGGDSGREMEVYTTEPGLQFYSGNFLDGGNVGKAGKVYKHRYGFCMEAQHYPDSPNKAMFPEVVLRPGETYRQTTVYKFAW